MFLKNLALKAIDFYRKYLSSFMLYKCRYYPTCSEYTREAIERKGFFLGLVKGLIRILRCNPLFPGGYDPYNKKVSFPRKRESILLDPRLRGDDK
jgi:uncharacterized protein